MKKRVFGILIVTLLLINLNFVIATCPSIGNDQVYVGGKNRRALQTIAELEKIWSSREPGFKRDSLTLNKICDLTKDYYAQLLDGYCEACDRLEGVTGYLDKPYTKYVSSTGLEFSSCNDNDIYK